MSIATTRRQSSSSRSIQARNRRVEQYRALVRPIALHYHHRCSEPLDDLIQVGLLGLLRAAELYRPETATPFEAFARPHVRGALLHYLRDVALPIRLPRRLDEQRLQLARLRSSWLACHHRSATEQELQQHLGLDASHWALLQAAEQLVRMQSLDVCLEEGAELPGLQAAPHPTEASDATGAPLPTTPLALLAGLEEPLRQVVERVILAVWSYRRTAAQLGVSPMTVQRRLRRALGLLRCCLLSPEPGWRPAASAVPGC